jgi:predicted DCC family thiol-disulfide oxidoreductase YuxK
VSAEPFDNSVPFAGWVFFDGECVLCRQTVRRFSSVLGRRGFEFRPLQSPGAAEHLGLDESDLLREMRLLLADGRRLGGADAVVEIARRIWWAWPLWLISRVPGMKPMLRAGYRVIATNRHCIGGVCALPRRRAWYDWLPLVLFPALALAVRDRVVPWVFMWLMAFAIYAGFKWFTYRDASTRRPFVPKRTRLLYLLLWPGMSLEEFAKAPPKKARTGLLPHWLAPAARTLLGAGLVWLLVPGLPVDAWLLRGWVGMIGIIMMLHFGTFHLLALALQTAGFNARPNMQHPTLARSLADFWGNRWNTAFSVLADRYGFRALTPRIGARAALAAVFLGSGLLHEAVITLPARGGYGLPTAYFALQAAGIFVERLAVLRQRPWLRRGFTWVMLIAPLGLLFPPVFSRNVMLPMLNAIGAAGNTP